MSHFHEEQILGSTKFPLASTLKDGFKVAWPICLGYFPIGLAFGVLAQKAGLHPLEIGLMSILVFAGSSQFIAVSMLSAGSGAAPIVLTTFMVNLRHLLMSSSMSVRLSSRVHRVFLSIFAYGITDESFAVNIARFNQGGWDPGRALVVNQVSNLAWISSTVLGGLGGQFIPAGSFGMDYALSGMFLCLLVFQLRGRIYAFVAVFSGVFAVLLALLVPGNAYVIIASLVGATAGFLLKRRFGAVEH